MSFACCAPLALAVLGLATGASARPLVTLDTPRVVAEAIADPARPELLCWCRVEIGIRLERPASVTVRLDGQAMLSGVDGGRVFSRGEGRVLGPGAHRIAVQGDDLSRRRLALGQLVPFALDVREVGQPGPVQTVSGVLETDLYNAPVLIVGRTFVRGVDLFDGHVVRQETDHEAKGSAMSLPVARTYTSAGRGSQGLLGAGWTFSWDRTLKVHGGCGLVVVDIRDGDRLVFRRREDGTLAPPPGYHSRLIENPDGSFDFFDLVGNRFHFGGDGRRTSRPLRLRSVTQTSGEKVVFRYNREDRLVRVEEQAPHGARLDLTYTRAGGFDRVATIRDEAGRVILRYAYDRHGNLETVTREAPLVYAYDQLGNPGAKPEGPRHPALVARYGYSIDHGRDPHQLVRVEAEGRTTRLVYYGEREAFAGEGGEGLGLRPFGKGEYVREVQESSGDLARFAYDYSGWREGVVRSWVATAGPSGEGVTLYVLDESGRLVETKERVPPPAGLVVQASAVSVHSVIATR